MTESTLSHQELDDERLHSDLAQLRIPRLGDSSRPCEVCDQWLQAGSELTVSLLRRPEDTSFCVARVSCLSHTHPTIGTQEETRELLVSGRIGQCQDQAMQTSWSVLLDPELTAVSPAGTTEVTHIIPDNQPVDGSSPDTASTALDHDHLLTDGGTTPPEPESGAENTDTPENDDVDRTPSLTPSVREFLRQDRGNECELCGTNNADGDVDLEIHHRVPKSEGGTDQPSNLMLVCRQCHQRHHGNTPSDRAVEAESPADEDSSDEAASETRTPLEPRSSPNETDSEILSIIEDEGPVPTGVIAEQVGCSKQHVRRQCWKLSGEQLIAPTKNEQWELLESASNQEITIGLPEKPKQAKRAGRDEVIRRMSAHGMAHTKIAEITGLSRATVDVAVDRARALRIDQAEEPSADLGAVAMRVSALLDLINHAQTESVDSQSLGD
jgi:predicted ArsR family transcriptional regulator